MRRGALLGLAPVRLVRELAGPGEIFGECARRGRQCRVRLHLAQPHLLAEGVGHLDDGDLGLGQIGKHGVSYRVFSMCETDCRQVTADGGGSPLNELGEQRRQA